MTDDDDLETADRQDVLDLLAAVVEGIERRIERAIDQTEADALARLANLVRHARDEFDQKN